MSERGERWIQIFKVKNNNNRGERRMKNQFGKQLKRIIINFAYVSYSFTIWHEFFKREFLFFAASKLNSPSIIFLYIEWKKIYEVDVCLFDDNIVMLNRKKNVPQSFPTHKSFCLLSVRKRMNFCEWKVNLIPSSWLDSSKLCVSSKDETTLSDCQ